MHEGPASLQAGAWPGAPRSGRQAAPPATPARDQPRRGGGGRPPTYRLVRADGVHLGPEHHRRENEEEQPLEAQQDQEDDRGGRREGAALCKRSAWGSGLWPAAHCPLPPGLPLRLQPCWTWGLLGATRLASRPRRGPPCPAPGCPSLTLVIPCYCLVPWPAGDVCLPVPSTVPGTQKDPEPRHEGLTPPQESLSSSERTLHVAQVEGPQCSPGCEFPRHFCTRHCHPLHLYLLRGETRAGPRIARWLLDLQPAGGSLTAGWALTLVGGEAHRST